MFGVVSPPTPAVRPVTSFAKARPARRAFAFSGHLLGGFPPLFDQLQQRLAAVSQTVALLEFVEQRDRLLAAIGTALPRPPAATPAESPVFCR